MKSIVICLIILLVGSNAVKLTLQDKYPLNFGPKRSIMTLLTQIEAKIKAGGPLDAITKLLDDFKKEITNEQLTHDSLWARQQQECASELQFRNAEISSAVGALKAGQETLDGCNAQRTRAAGDLSITKSQLQEARQFLIQITNQRKEQETYFNTQKDKFEQAMKVLDGALVILQELYNGEVNFAQVAKHSNKLLKHAAEINNARALGPLMAALVQLGSQSETQIDANLVDRVKGLLNNLREKLQGQFDIQYQDEQNAIAAFAEENTRITAVIANLEATQSALEVEISQLDKCIVTQTGIVISATAKRDRNQQLLNDANNLCDAVKLQYESASKSRQEELKLLAAIKDRVELRFAQISSGVTERGKQDDFNYENQSAYDKQTFTASSQ